MAYYKKTSWHVIQNSEPANSLMNHWSELTHNNYKPWVCTQYRGYWCSGAKGTLYASHCIQKCYKSRHYGFTFTLINFVVFIAAHNEKKCLLSGSFVGFTYIYMSHLILTTMQISVFCYLIILYETIAIKMKYVCLSIYQRNPWCMVFFSIL